LTNNHSLICQIRDFGSGQILQPRQLYRSPGLAKIAPWWLAHRDSFSAKAPGHITADGATNVYSLNRRAVIANVQHNNELIFTLTSHVEPPRIWHICFCATHNPTHTQKQKSQTYTLVKILIFSLYKITMFPK
jgi:hypothetical protein